MLKLNSTKKIQLLMESDAWPLAILEHEVPYGEVFKNFFNRTIYQSVFSNISVENKKVLNYMCDNEILSEIIADEGAEWSVGYSKDIDSYQRNNLVMTNSLKKVESMKYDYILVCDKLDCIEGDPIEHLMFLKKLCKEFLYIRLRPWSSRNVFGYVEDFSYALNKAYCHLFLTEEEMSAKTGIDVEKFKHNKKVIRPFKTYSEWFNKAGLFVKECHSNTNQLSDFFLSNKDVRNRLMEIWETDIFPREINVNYIEYVLTTTKFMSQINKG